MLELRAPFRSRTVPWREVSRVELIDLATAKGPLQTVRIQLRVGRPLNLYGRGGRDPPVRRDRSCLERREAMTMSDWSKMTRPIPVPNQ